MGCWTPFTSVSRAWLTERVRILVVNWQDRENPLGGGAETHLHETFGRIARAGHEVVALVSGFEGAPDRVELDGIEVHRTGRRYTFSLHARRYFDRELRSRNFDVIVEDLNKIPLFTPRWNAAPVVPLVHHLFGATAFAEASPPVAALTWLLERPIPRAFRGLRGIAVSESTRSDLASRGMDAELISVIPNGIDLKWFCPDDSESRFPAPTFVYMGRLRRYKRVDLLIEAVARLKAEGLDVRFNVGGKGPDRERLEKLAGRLGVQDRVRFLGFVSEEEKRTLLRRSWANLLTSPKEGWGISNLEAAGCGTPTVASDAPGLRESVVHEETGLLVPHADGPALAAAIARIAREPALRDQLGLGAARFATGYSWDASADAVLRLLQEVASGREKRPGVA